MEEQVSEGTDRETGPDWHRNWEPRRLRRRNPREWQRSPSTELRHRRNRRKGFGPSGMLERLRSQRHRRKGLGPTAPRRGFDPDGRCDFGQGTWTSFGSTSRSHGETEHPQGEGFDPRLVSESPNSENR